MRELRRWSSGGFKSMLPITKAAIEAAKKPATLGPQLAPVTH
jgi:hypothetical protein